MTESDRSNGGIPDMPVAPVRKRSFHISLLWVVPLVAALIGAWLVVKGIRERGPRITITFKSAEGLEAGKTKVKYKDVDIGTVTAVELGPDLQHVLVKAELVKSAQGLISENTRFWVARARVSATAIYGLGTVFSGAYIDLDPGKPGKPARHFTGLEEPPIVTTGLPGRHFIVESARKESLEVGAPVYFRQIRVGEVVSYRLRDDGRTIEAKVFVHAPYHRFVWKNTRFWDSGGIDLKVDASGVHLYTESLATVLAGGIAFDTIQESPEPLEEAPEDYVFRLFPNREKALEKTYSPDNYFVLLFEGSVRGLSVGAPVEFRGIPVGKVIDIRSEFNLSTNKVKIPVIIATEPERISFVGTAPNRESGKNLFEYLVSQGLRAQLRSGNVLTGQLYVALDLFPNAQPAHVTHGGRYGYAELPTVPSPLEEIGSKLSSLLDKMDRLPLEQIGADLRDTLQGAKRITTSQDLLNTVKSLEAASKEMHLLLKTLRTQTTPEMDAALGQARTSLAAVESLLRSDSPLHSRLIAAAEEFAAASRTLKVLAEALERDPQSVLFGKGQEE
ncbi:MAG: MlaD family protein [Desulfosoma sp.]